MTSNAQRSKTLSGSRAHDGIVARLHYYRDASAFEGSEDALRRSGFITAETRIPVGVSGCCRSDGGSELELTSRLKDRRLRVVLDRVVAAKRDVAFRGFLLAAVRGGTDAIELRAARVQQFIAYSRAMAERLRSTGEDPVLRSALQDNVKAAEKKLAKLLKGRRDGGPQT